MNNSIIIFSGYKCASTTLEATFHCKKSHDIFNESLIDDNINTILLPLSDKIDKICYSAYFQDIVVPSYEYSPFQEINGFLSTQTCGNKCGICQCKFLRKRKNTIENINTDKLIEHFLKVKKIMLEKIYINTYLRTEKLKEILNLDFNFYSNEIQIFFKKIKNKIRKVIYFNISNINENFDTLKYEIYGKERNDIKIINKNMGEKKWCSNKYKDFLKNI